MSIYIEDRTPVIFKQPRVGKNGREFVLHKFRSMPTNSANIPSAKAGSLRITRVGKIIRRTNIDEIPQLYNILRGDMSVVGPRPAMTTQVELNELRRDAGVLNCKPGLTGLAQVNSYDGMPEAEKVRWDKNYAANISFTLDIYIIMKTFSYLMRRPPTY